MKAKLYNIKQSLEVKDIDSQSRKVAMYLARFDSIDSDQDLIRKGAFKKSLKERGIESTSNRKIAFLRHHDWEKQIGKFVELYEDDQGLYAVGQLGRSTDGEDALKDYEDGIIKEHSIGFQYVQSKMEFIEDKNGNYNEIKELILWEGSAVTFGSNPYTYVVGMKGQDKIDQIEKINNELNVCIKALANGQGTDERLHNLEMKVKYLNSQLVLLATQEPNVIHSTEGNKPKDVEIIKPFDWKTVFNTLSHKETYADYPKQAKENARRGIRLNEAVNNRCATAVGKQRARQLSSGEALSLDTLKRTYSFLSRAKTYYKPGDTEACGTISYLLWGGDAMLNYCERKLNAIDD